MAKWIATTWIHDHAQSKFMPPPSRSKKDFILHTTRTDLPNIVGGFTSLEPYDLRPHKQNLLVYPHVLVHLSQVKENSILGRFFTPWPLTLWPQNLITSSLYAYTCLSQVWLKSVQWFWSYSGNELFWVIFYKFFDPMTFDLWPCDTKI